MPHKQLILPVILFALTVLTTNLFGGFAYSVSLILILLCHEMGHYLTARYYGVPASLPYFIPSPLPPFGTFGAMIKMEGRIPDRKALFDIGIMGPAMGLIIAIPATVIGIALSEVTEIPQTGSSSINLRLGDSIIFSLIAQWIHGPLLENRDILLHPIGFAGWAGLLVTALNLLPMGQLDGGHIVYALFPRKSSFVYWFVLLALVCLAIVVEYPTWFFFPVLVYLLTRLRHPPTLEDEQPVGKKRTFFGILSILFLILSFPPVPIMMSPPPNLP